MSDQQLSALGLDLNSLEVLFVYKDFTVGSLDSFDNRASPFKARERHLALKLSSKARKTARFSVEALSTEYQAQTDAKFRFQEPVLDPQLLEAS